MSISVATLGFTIAGILFLIYSFSFQKAATETLKKQLSAYAWGYGFVGVAFLIWGVATLVPTLLQDAIILGDFLILLGSVCLLGFLSAANSSMRKIAIVAGIVAAIVFAWLRASYFFPSATMDEGILLFNTQAPVAITLGLIFLFVWFPANLKAAKLVASALKDSAMRSLYGSIYALSTLVAIIFLAARTPLVATLTFALLCLCFAILLYSNFAQKKLYRETHGR